MWGSCRGQVQVEKSCRGQVHVNSVTYLFLSSFILCFCLIRSIRHNTVLCDLVHDVNTV